MSVGDRERAEGPVWLTMWWPPHWDTALKGTQQWREKVSLSRKHRATPNGSTAGWGGKLGGQELTLSPFTPMSPLNPGKPSSPWERQRVKVGGAGRGLREHRQKGVDFRYGRAGGQEGRGEGRAGGHWGRGGQVGTGGGEGRWALREGRAGGRWGRGGQEKVHPPVLRSKCTRFTFSPLWPFRPRIPSTP